MNYGQEKAISSNGCLAKSNNRFLRSPLNTKKIGAQIDKIAVKLDKEKDGLLKDNLMLEQLYQKNKDYFDALNIYIAAGELKMQELQTTIIPEAMKKHKKRMIRWMYRSPMTIRNFWIA